jgi:uncharacterized membrane protein
MTMAPYVPPPSEAPRKTVVVLQWLDPLRWLALGSKDVRAHPGIGIFYGLAFWTMALVLGAVFKSNPEYTMSIASGCLLVGPFLAMGLYDVSRRNAAGLDADFGASLICWDQHIPSMGMLVLVLIVLELLWGRASLVVFAVFFNTGMPSTASVVGAVFNPENWEFLLAYMVVGGAFAAIVFSLSVISIPMILDRDVDAISAAIASLEVVFHNTGIMVFWGFLLSLLVILAFLVPWGAGIIVVGPLLGHASWHAYQSAIHWPETTAGTA